PQQEKPPPAPLSKASQRGDEPRDAPDRDLRALKNEVPLRHHAVEWMCAEDQRGRDDRRGPEQQDGAERPARDDAGGSAGERDGAIRGPAHARDPNLGGVMARGLSGGSA